MREDIIKRLREVQKSVTYCSRYVAATDNELVTVNVYRDKTTITIREDTRNTVVETTMEVDKNIILTPEVENVLLNALNIMEKEDI